MFVDLSTELLSGGYGVRFRPTGRSMYPTIRDGEAVTVEPVSAAQVRRCDVILYRTERGLIAHRVRKIERGTDGSFIFIMRGDSATADDDPVDARQILGRVVRVERGGREIKVRGLVSSLRVARARLAKYRRRLATQWLVAARPTD